MYKKVINKYIISILLITIFISTAITYYFNKDKTHQADCKHIVDGCNIYFNDEKIAKFYFESENNALIQPFYTSVSGTGIDSVSMEISGINYYMGYNHYSLRSNGSEFTYKGVLPSCIYRNMNWKVTLRIIKGSISYTTNYDFFIRRSLDELT